jgi:hypothetical protein
MFAPDLQCLNPISLILPHLSEKPATRYETKEQEIYNHIAKYAKPGKVFCCKELRRIFHLVSRYMRVGVLTMIKYNVGQTWLARFSPSLTRSCDLCR